MSRHVTPQYAAEKLRHLHGELPSLRATIRLARLLDQSPARALGPHPVIKFAFDRAADGVQAAMVLRAAEAITLLRAACRHYLGDSRDDPFSTSRHQSPLALILQLRHQRVAHKAEQPDIGLAAMRGASPYGGPWGLLEIAFALFEDALGRLEDAGAFASFRDTVFVREDDPFSSDDVRALVDASIALMARRHNSIKPE